MINIKVVYVALQEIRNFIFKLTNDNKQVQRASQEQEN